MDHMSISGTEPSSMIRSQTEQPKLGQRSIINKTNQCGKHTLVKCPVQCPVNGVHWPNVGPWSFFQLDIDQIANDRMLTKGQHWTSVVLPTPTIGHYTAICQRWPNIVVISGLYPYRYRYTLDVRSGGQIK